LEKAARIVNFQILESAGKAFPVMSFPEKAFHLHAEN
jgi:hypothetical protein